MRLMKVGILSEVHRFPRNASSICSKCFSSENLAMKMIQTIKVGCMLKNSTYYPYTCKPEDVLEQQQRMRKYYCYSDTSSSGEYPAILNELNLKMKGFNIKMEEGDLEIMKKYPVDFVSFSYYSSSCVAKG